MGLIIWLRQCQIESSIEKLPFVEQQRKKITPVTGESLDSYSNLDWSLFFCLSWLLRFSLFFFEIITHNIL